MNRDNLGAMAPFSSTYTPQFSELLYKLQATLVLSTYQAGKVIFLSAKNEDSLTQLPRTFEKAMGIALTDDTMAIACRNEVIEFKNSPAIASSYPNKPNVYDAFYLPRQCYYTGNVDLHDLHYTNTGELVAVNTLFSCLVKINGDFSFSPFWQPKWIDKISPEDKCHLNGLAMQNQKPKYATAFNQGNTKQSWRDNITKTGVIIDIESSEILASKLGMPHSPKIYNDKIYLLESAHGHLVQIDPNTGEREIIFKEKAFLRGMTLIQDYLFIGVSKIREKSSTFAALDIAKHQSNCGIIAIHLPTASKVAQFNYQTSVDELYDVNHLSGITRPNILNHKQDLHHLALHLANTTYWASTNE